MTSRWRWRRGRRWSGSVVRSSVSAQMANRTRRSDEMPIAFVVRLTPRGGRDTIEGSGPDGELKVRVAAPPVDGAANQALLRLLSDTIGVPSGAVRIVGGETARTKRVSIVGVAAA